MGPNVYVKVEGVGWGINDKYCISYCRAESYFVHYPSLSCLIDQHFGKCGLIVQCWCQGFPYILYWGYHTYCTGVSIHTVLGFPYILYWGYHTYCTGVTIHTVLGFPDIMFRGIHTYCTGVSIHTVLGFPYILYWGVHTYCTGAVSYTHLRAHET